ncbi:hypothetical protein FQZ97_993210 [compost metagenome]
MASGPLSALHLGGVPFMGDGLEGGGILRLGFFEPGLLGRIDALGQEVARLAALFSGLGQGNALPTVLAECQRVLLAARAVVFHPPDLAA